MTVTTDLPPYHILRRTSVGLLLATDFGVCLEAFGECTPIFAVGASESCFVVVSGNLELLLLRVDDVGLGFASTEDLDREVGNVLGVLGIDTTRGGSSSHACNVPRTVMMSAPPVLIVASVTWYTRDGQTFCNCLILTAISYATKTSLAA
jgi:hypothetical protein